MGNKTKGSNAERELLRKFTENNFRAARVAGSGVNEESPCDLIAGKSGKKYAIECKSSRKNQIYISKTQIEDFMIFSQIMGLEPVVALRFLRQGWIFLTPEKLRDSGKYWAVSLDDAQKNGAKFSQFFGE
jgi:Holliday junction resolvase